MRRFAIFFLTAMSLVLIIVLLVRPNGKNFAELGVQPRVLTGEAGSLLSPAKKLASFSLTDSKGQAFTNAELGGSYTLLFMGFASCAHFCPPTMYKLGLVKDRLEQHFVDKGYPPIRVLFVSVDPGRDSLELLDEYINAYGENFLAVTGDVAQIDLLVRSLGVTSRVIDAPDEYVVEHSPAVFLIDPDGRFTALFSPPHRVEPVATDIKRVAAGL